jgi:tetratricopeptide (TPR) repeat protein
MRIPISRLATFVSTTSAMSLLASAAPAQTSAPTLAPIAPEVMAPLDRLEDLEWIDRDATRNLAASAARIAVADSWRMAASVAPLAITLGTRDFDRELDFGFDYAPRAFARLPESPRAPWAADDPADSLYRLARQTLNSGEYRRAAQLFAQITRQYPTSQYRADAAYWRAFALYRIGGIADLHEALQALDSAGTDSAGSSGRKSTRVRETKLTMVAPAASPGGARTTFYMDWAKSSDRESAVLATRIRGALAARGDATAAAQIARTADSSATSCDEEDAQLRVEALNALVQMDPKNADPAIAKVLARRDTCSAPLRRGALGLIARSDDAHSTELLISTAKTDPSMEVRAEAIRLLGRAPDDRATAALVEFATSTDKAPLQRIAVRSLAAQQSPASVQAIRSLMTRTDVSNDVRITALHYAGKNDLQIGDLTKMYDASADRSTRQEIISLLSQRPEPQAADKLIDIARTSTDPITRREAISALSRKKDPRVTKLLLDIIDK